MALESMRQAYAKDPIRELIEAREKAERDELNRLHTAKLEGKLEMARRLLAAGVDRETIRGAAGLTTAEMDSLGF